MLNTRMRILLVLLGIAMIAGSILIPGQWATLPHATPVADHRQPYGKPLEIADKEGISLPPGLVGQEVVVAIDAKTNKVTAILQIPRISGDGTQTVELPPGVRFHGIAWRYSHGVPEAYLFPEARYEMSLQPRDPKEKPRTYTITIKEN